MSKNCMMQRMSDLSATRCKIIVQWLVFVPVIVTLLVIAGERQALAKGIVADSVDVWHIVKPSVRLEVQKLLVEIPVVIGVKRVAYKQVIANNQSVFATFSIEREADQLVVSGWRAIQLNANSNFQLQKIFLQKVRITVPYSAATGGWDVRSLERELERLGVKVKPRPSLPKPTQQLRG